jgi:hypothetical protein
MIKWIELEAQSFIDVTSLMNHETHFSMNKDLFLYIISPIQISIYLF